MELAAKKGYRIAAAGTHPFANWQTQEITPYDHYLGTRNDMGDLAQRLLIFGTQHGARYWNCLCARRGATKQTKHGHSKSGRLGSSGNIIGKN
jgi:hypothetical protein